MKTYQLFLATLVICLGFANLSNAQDTQRIPDIKGAERPKVDRIEKIDYFNDGKEMLSSMFTVDGRLISKRYYYHDGEKKIRKEEYYDLDGNKTEESNYDGEGRLDDNINGWAAKKWIYRRGIIAEEDTYNEDGRLTEKLIFNDRGDLEERQGSDGREIDNDPRFRRGSAQADMLHRFCDLYGPDASDQFGAVDDRHDIQYNY